MEIQNSGDVVAPLVTGQIDLAGTSFGSGLYNAILREVNVVAVADNGQLDTDLAGSAAVVKAGTAAEYGDDWCALEGKKVAIVSRVSGFYPSLVKALESCDLTEDDVEIVELGFGETTPAVQNGSVDVAFHVEPFVSSGVADGILEIWKPMDEAREGQQMNLLLFSPTFAEKHDVGLRFLRRVYPGRTRLPAGRAQRRQVGAWRDPLEASAGDRSQGLQRDDHDGHRSGRPDRCRQRP